MSHPQDSVNIDSKVTVGIGLQVATLDFSWMVYLFLMGDRTTRKALKPILLGKPELAAALSLMNWDEIAKILTDSMSGELNAAFGKAVVDSLLRDLVAEAQKPAPTLGEAQASAPLSLETYHEVMATLKTSVSVNSNEDTASKELKAPMEVSSGDTLLEGLGKTTPRKGEGQPSASAPPVAAA